MSIINLMKDIVINTVDEVLKEKENLNIPRNGRDDIIAYVLNRIQPKYATGERGLLHGILDAKYKIQQRIDIFFLIYEAIHIINRRGSNPSDTGWASSESSFFLPHIVGQVLEESTLSVVSDVEVSLLFNGAPAAMVDSFWDNPYKTNGATKGHYHFWPHFSEPGMGKKSVLSFTLSFCHTEFADKKIDIDLTVDLKSKRVQTQFIPLVLLSAEN
jgi:competence protein ComFB